MLDNNFLGIDQARGKIKTRGAAKDGSYFPKLELMYSVEKDATELDVKIRKRCRATTCGDLDTVSFKAPTL